MYHGDIRLEDTLDVKFTTRRFTTGAPFTLAGTPVISAYVGNGTTEITAGITLTVDFDARTGLHNVRVAATAANGYTAGTNVQLVITTGTVDSVSVVGEVIGTFSIECRSGLRPTTAGRTLDVSAGGEAGIDWANVGSPTTAQNLSGTNIKTDQVVASVSGAVGSVTGAVGSVIGLTPATVHADLDDIQARLPAALTVDGNIKADTLRVGGTLQTAGDLAAMITVIDDFLDTEIAAILAAVDTEVAAIKTQTDKLTFTVANVLDANIQRVNDVALIGDGAATPWGP